MTGTRPGQGGSVANVRFIGDVPGRFVLVDRNAATAEPQAFPFTARSVSTAKAVVTSEVMVGRGERVVLHFDGIGIRRGTIGRVLKGGFSVDFTDRDSTGGEDIEARIGWLNEKTRRGAEDRRQHKRVMPKNATAVLILGAEQTLECRVRDMSASGAAVIAEARPPMGTLVAVGAVPGRVVRYFDGGFAVRFVELQDLAVLEGLLTLQTRGDKSLAARRIGAAG